MKPFERFVHAPQWTESGLGAASLLDFFFSKTNPAPHLKTQE